MTDSKHVKINTTFKNVDSTEPLKKYATEKLSNCLKKYIHHDTEPHLVLKVEKNRQIAEIDFNVDGKRFCSQEESSDMYKTIDQLINSISTQLRRHKDKLTSHH